MKLSVIICTRNRPDKIGVCLKSILVNTFSDFEIIVVDQSDNDKTERIIKQIDFRIRYFKIQGTGLSRARNLGIQKSQGEIIAFTDDDCIVTKNWLANIYLSFEKNKGITAVFGRVLPDNPKGHSGLRCGSHTKFRKEKIFTAPRKYKRFIFLGNAMSIRRSIFDKIGFFKEWLGVGSIGMATEDEEIIYRLLKNGGKVLLNPKVVVYHNNWLTEKELHRLMVRYSGGFFAAFGYYALQGDKIAKGYLTIFLRKRLKKWTQEIKFSLNNFHPKYLLRFLLTEISFELGYYLRGVLIAFYFAIKANFGNRGEKSASLFSFSN